MSTHHNPTGKCPICGANTYHGNTYDGVRCQREGERLNGEPDYNRIQDGDDPELDAVADEVIRKDRQSFRQ